MATRAQRFDVFCRVVDNFGDAGVALRLARQLVAEHHAQVTLWIDDLESLARIAPRLDVRSADQRHDGVRVRTLGSQVANLDDDLPQVVIEAFGCALPDTYLDAMERSARRPVWINLEYLSAEPWVDGAHGLPSPHPQRNLKRWFFFPGFTAATGGLIRERALLAARDRFVSDASSRAEVWAALDAAPPAADALTVSLFCYDNEALDALLDAWRRSAEPIACRVPEGVASAAIERLLGRAASRAGVIRSTGSLTLAVAPYVDQIAFDRRLWGCDLNIVRGEDSFVRAQWAAKPFAWHIYPQAALAHIVKLDAFFGRYAAGLAPDDASALRTFWKAFNEGNGAATAAAWRPLHQALPALRAHARRWAEALAGEPDLASQLVDFARKRL